ncbi:MAG: hypothetical protein E7579_07265 [Ruminococcaceae bacterium]|nr:hypothetical protein [Oscillospiraceae bacterium]
MATHRPKKIPSNKKSARTRWLPQSKKVLEGVWGNLFLKKVPPTFSSKNTPHRRISRNLGVPISEERDYNDSVSESEMEQRDGTHCN